MEESFCLIVPNDRGIYTTVVGIVINMINVRFLSENKVKSFKCYIYFFSPRGKQRVLDTLGMTQLSERVPGSRLIL